MSILAERLLESWLDNQTERRYQPAFIQALISNGWRVLHNTRHSPIEQGKDVIARSPDGQLYCFQLKGNPGGRLTKAEAAKHLDQFIELLDTSPAPEFRRAKSESHIGVFVTNGEIDEEARLTFERTGERTERASCPAAGYELWARGKLLEIMQPAMAVLPAAPEEIRAILNFMAIDGSSQFELEDLHSILESLLPQKNSSTFEKYSKISALLFISEIIKSQFYSKENHFELLRISVCVSASIYRFDANKYVRLAEGYQSICLAHCEDLLSEALENHYDPIFVWSDSDPMAEFEVQRERRRLLAVASSLLLLAEKELERGTAALAQSIIEAEWECDFLWGEAQIPSKLVQFHAMNKFRCGLKLELGLARLLDQILESNRSAGKLEALPSPYYDFTDVYASKTGASFLANRSLENDGFEGRCYFAQCIMYMMAKRNLKKSCKQMWRSYSHLIHEDFDLAETSFYLPGLSRDGGVIGRQIKASFWHDLVISGVELGSCAPKGVQKMPPWLVAAYISIIPYRAWCSVVMWLDNQVAKTWYNQESLPAHPHP